MERSSQDGNFKPGQTLIKSCGMQAVYEKEIFKIKPLAAGLHVQNHMSPRTYFHAASGVAQIKRSAFRYLAAVSVQKVLS